jgi:hypothetical protein
MPVRVEVDDEPNRRRPRGLVVAFWLLLALLLGLTYWLLLNACGLRMLQGSPLLTFCPAPVAVPAIEPALAAEIARQRALEDEIERLELALLRAPPCAPPAPLGPPAAIEPPPAPPAEEPPSPRAEAPPPEPCPQRRPVEVVLLLDASNSMGWDFDIDPTLDERLSALDARAERLGNRIERMQESGNILGLMVELIQLQGEQEAIQREAEALRRAADRPDRINRIDVAKRALTEVVGASPDDLDFTFVTFNQCGRPQPQGRFGPDRRGALISRIQGTTLGDNTALADSIAAVPGLIESGRSADQPVNVVLVSDGEDSCGGDPCAAATALKRSLPYAFVNAIAISRDAEAVRCVPEATDGLFVQADDAERLATELARATGQDLPEHCR